MSKRTERKQMFYKVMAGLLAGIMIAGTVLGIVIYFV